MIGIDVGKSSLVVCFALGTDRIERTFENTFAGHQKMHCWLVKHGGRGDLACVESTGTYHLAVALFLYLRGYSVSVVNPRRIKAYAESRLSRTKNDPADARLIAEFGDKERADLPLWQPPAQERVALKSLQDRLDELQHSLRRHQQRLEHDHNDATMASLQREQAFITEEIHRLQQAMIELFQHTPALSRDIELLCSIPGLGTLTARRFVARVEINHFDSAASFAAFLGVTPSEHSSGTSVHRKTRMSKVGSKRLRTALYFPALLATRFNPQVKALFDRLVAKGHVRKSALGAAMRKLAQQMCGVWSSGLPYSPTIGLCSLESLSS